MCDADIVAEMAMLLVPGWYRNMVWLCRQSLPIIGQGNFKVLTAEFAEPAAPQNFL
jgi:hypothetical protein